MQREWQRREGSATHPLVTADWLQQHLDDAHLAVVDCRFRLMEPAAGAAHYASAHLPGAVFLDVERELSAPKGPHGGRHPLPDPHRLAARLGELGIGDGTAVIAYDDDGSFAPRLWWLLRYLGHDAVAVLDGGLPAWEAAGGRLSAELPRPEPRRLTVSLRPGMVADLEAVARRTPETVLLDARAPERYRGEVEPIDPVPGRIPGALNAPYFDGQTPDGGWLPAADQKRRFAALPPDAPLIVYCGSGLTACVDLLALELAGRTGARLYAGSYSDWISHPERPVARG